MTSVRFRALHERFRPTFKMPALEGIREALALVQAPRMMMLLPPSLLLALSPRIEQCCADKETVQSCDRTIMSEIVVESWLRFARFSLFPFTPMKTSSTQTCNLHPDLSMARVPVIEDWKIMKDGGILEM